MKARPGADLNCAGLSALIDAAYADIKSRLDVGGGAPSTESAGHDDSFAVDGFDHRRLIG